MVELSFGQKAVVEERAAEVGQIALHFLQMQCLAPIDIEGNLSVAEVALFEQLHAYLFAAFDQPFVLNLPLREGVADVDEARR